jgi:hypothetical protein
MENLHAKPFGKLATPNPNLTYTNDMFTENDAKASKKALSHTFHNEWRTSNHIKQKIDAGIEGGSDDEHDIWCEESNGNRMARAHGSTTYEN